MIYYVYFRYWLCLSLTFYFCRFFSDEIIDRIHEAGFRIAARKETTLSRDVAEEFYADHKDKDYYNELVDHMTRFVAITIN